MCRLHAYCFYNIGGLVFGRTRLDDLDIFVKKPEVNKIKFQKKQAQSTTLWMHKMGRMDKAALLQKSSGDYGGLHTT